MPLMRSFFIALSHNRPLRKFSEHSKLGRKMSSRFVAGLTIDDALSAATSVEAQGMFVTLDSLGESVTREEEARAAAAIYHKLLDEIQARNLKANVSLKLSQMGIDLSPALAETIVTELVEHACRTHNFVRIDMEGSQHTQITLDLVHKLNDKPEFKGHVGIVVQAYLHRTRADVEDLNRRGIRIRLCKGAYKEPADIAFPEKSDVDKSFVELSKIMLDSPIYHGLATHDEKMVNAAKAYAKEKNIAPSRFEFQMLYGIRRDLQQQLIKDGYNVRIYVPFGSEWYPYFMRRLAERPANVFFLMKNFFRK
jgi:proline dehydrogenase